MQNTSDLICSLQTLPSIDATYDAEDSHFFLSNLLSLTSSYYTYDSRVLQEDPFSLMTTDTDLSSLFLLVNNFALFHAYVNITHNNSAYPYLTNFPLSVFRYVMLEDESWSNYNSHRRKKGYIVEGMQWSNGFFYQVREDKMSDYLIYHLLLRIDHKTKLLSSYPDFPFSTSHDS